ncbi:LacI family transcriptional regulator [Rhodocaloribacter litoris]|uniref:LacI family DNA-binding transcriptional regulator n=1 Tax=Rhodocaloribacter litoris TaxID=2558931 RepID=UPI00142262C6|nr:LacI family DNA-binding transcriptional regulator [Rhodocaloribacter litoris]QXD15322.1 LacI family transcriptional regulator [Rhodocaloribacter litoris]GIV62333.1 MAG: LacI family transcriptional regulator [Rhodothermaceae bacterium]
MPQEKSKVTIYDVAARAGVAISTVSRVLNNSDDVSDRTRARVLRAIEELQFRPDRTAKTLAQQATQLLAVAMPTFTTPFHTELMKGIRTCLRERDVDLLLCDLGSTKRHLTLMNFLRRGTVDGLLLAGVDVTEAIAQELQALHAPVVLIGSEWESFDSFYWDDVAGARQAVEHLIEQGHRRIGMITTATGSPLQNRRIQGYREALEAAGLPFDPSLLASGFTEKHAGYSEEAGYEAMQTLLQVDPPLTAVFASSDVQAIGAWKAIIDAGKKVPDDIALVGYDDIKTSTYIGLTSIAQDMQAIGQRATEVLLERMEGKRTTPPEAVLVVPKLQVRRSSRRTR